MFCQVKNLKKKGHTIQYCPLDYYLLSFCKIKPVIFLSLSLIFQRKFDIDANRNTPAIAGKIKLLIFRISKIRITPAAAGKGLYSY